MHWACPASPARQPCQHHSPPFALARIHDNLQPTVHALCTCMRDWCPQVLACPRCAGPCAWTTLTRRAPWAARSAALPCTRATSSTAPGGYHVGLGARPRPAPPCRASSFTPHASGTHWPCRCSSSTGLRASQRTAIPEAGQARRHARHHVPQRLFLMQRRRCGPHGRCLLSHERMRAALLTQYAPPARAAWRTGETGRQGTPVVHPCACLCTRRLLYLVSVDAVTRQVNW